MRVTPTAGETYAERLRAKGALVTSYREGMAERIQKLAGGPVDLALDTAPVPADPELVHGLIQGSAKRAEQDTAPPSGPLADLVRAAGGDPHRVARASRLITRPPSAPCRGSRRSAGEQPDDCGDALHPSASELDTQSAICRPMTSAWSSWRK
jgi:hypothetical protein